MSRDLTNLFIDETFQYLVQTSGSVFTDGTGSLLTEVDITASNAVSSSYALTASYALNSVPQVSASYAVSASHAINADNSISSSYSVTSVSSSFSNVSISASYANVADTSISSSYALTASYAESAIAENVTFDDINFAYTASNVQIALQRLSDNKADISQLTSNVNVFPTTVASDVSGYVTLVTSSADVRYNVPAADVPTGTISGSNQFIAALITDGALFTGDPGIVNITTVGQVRRTGGGSNSSAAFYYELYKRSGSVETLIATSDLTSEVNEEHYEEFSAAAILNNGTFTSDDRIVIKYYGSLVNPQGADPSFEFMFGGDTPIRTLFPVPAAVLVSPWNGQFTGDAGITGSLRIHNVNGLDAQFNEDGNISLTGNTVTLTSDVNSQINGGLNVLINDTGSQTFQIDAPGIGGLTLGVGGYTGGGGGWNTTANMTFYGVDQAFFSAENDFYIKNIFNDTGSITVWSENALTLRGDTSIEIYGGDPLTGTEPQEQINITGKAFATSIASNINGFSTTISQDSTVRQFVRAFVETPMQVAVGKTVTVEFGATLKVINEL